MNNIYLHLHFLLIVICVVSVVMANYFDEKRDEPLIIPLYMLIGIATVVCLAYFVHFYLAWSYISLWQHILWFLIALVCTVACFQTIYLIWRSRKRPEK